MKETIFTCSYGDLAKQSWPKK